MVCAQLMHKKNTSKDCDKRDNNNNKINNIINKHFGFTCYGCPCQNLSKKGQLKLAFYRLRIPERKIFTRYLILTVPKSFYS